MRRMMMNVLLSVVIASVVACSRPTAGNVEENDTAPLTYENELFSIDVPRGWVCDASCWNGLESMQNSVEIFDPEGNVVSFYIVKTFLPYVWEGVEMAKELSKMGRALSDDDVELIHETDSVEVGGYPACILYYANYVDNDTIIQKQFVTCMEDSHILIYFNENFHIQNWEVAQKLGDSIIGTIKLKKVVNPLDNDSIFKKVIEKTGDL